MRSNWKRHRGQTRIPCPTAGLEQGFARAAFGIAPHFPVPHGVAFTALPVFVLGFSSCPLHPTRTFFVHKYVLEQTQRKPGKGSEVVGG